MNKRIEYKDYPKLPDWLIDHIYKILDEQSSSPITYDDNFKDRMLEEAKKMTTDQLLEKMKTDTTFAKVILN